MANLIRNRLTTGQRDKSPSHSRVGIAALLANFALVGFSGPTLAGGAGTILFNIPAQPLSSGVIEFSRQANIQVLTAGSRLQGVNTPGVNGRFSVTAGIEHLLVGTGFGYHLVGSDTISLVPPPGRRANLDRPTEAQTGTVAKADEGANAGPAGKDGGAGEEENEKLSPALQEIIVTAQKYRQRVFDVPMDLQVVSGDTLKQYSITNLSDLQFDVPGLYVFRNGTSHLIYLRGVTNGFGNGSMVGQYIDSADITAEGISGTSGEATGDGGLYDLSRVEVLKGPQGTLYGDGSMGGVIRYITNQPVLNRFQMSEDVAAMFTQYGAPSQLIETMLNTPLVSGTLGLRFAGMFEHDGGWVDEPAANLKNINGGNVADVRVEALWQPTENLAVSAMQIVHRHAYGIGAGEDTSGNITPLFGTTYVPNGEDNSNLSNLTLTYDLAGARLTSSSTYANEEEVTNNHSYPLPLPTGTTFWFLFPHESVSNKDYNEELRLVRAGEGPWQWTLGGFYKRFTDLEPGAGDYFGLSGSSLSSAFYSPPGPAEDDSSNSWAGFADTSYRLVNRLTLGAGIRYFKDRETLIEPPGISFERATFSSTDPRFYLHYQVTSHINSYATVSKGFRSGGFNYPSSVPPYQPEDLWSYDVGAKIRYPRQGLIADIDLFYMNYTNFVTEEYVPPQYIEANIGKARIKGVDADLTWLPGNDWRLSLNSEVLDTAFLTTTAVSGYAPGDRLPFAPKYSFTASVERDFRWADRLEYVELYYYEMSRVQYRQLGRPLEQSDVLHFLNTRVGIHWNANLTAGLFVHNLLNDRGNEGAELILDESTRPRPRTFGIDFSVNFK